MCIWCCCLYIWTQYILSFFSSSWCQGLAATSGLLGLFYKHFVTLSNQASHYIRKCTRILYDSVCLVLYIICIVCLFSLSIVITSVCVGGGGRELGALLCDHVVGGGERAGCLALWSFFGGRVESWVPCILITSFFFCFVFFFFVFLGGCGEREREREKEWELGALPVSYFVKFTTHSLSVLICFVSTTIKSKPQ